MMSLERPYKFCKILSIPSEMQKENILLKNILGSQNESAKKFGLGFKDPSKIIESFVPKLL